ncbi:hypothetical protein SJAG_01889 [Schizosaccharomyces japonicus yFS275]|uniref:Gef2/Nod1 domain-containing protein n=1 Tax=Schizosaccharomyces japonicus (strain yFS275 / FY16936) TaxID=402676 RepID=B6JZ65_SCHJY|nr:hypothetical protein SJAG_01889 [Schizosaccharomyces japonicus yFS275]EEB06833.1 hypothetical protein SJAG_01889 [Schizosaccharomyces japonicus yFS275]
MDSCTTVVEKLSAYRYAFGARKNIQDVLANFSESEKDQMMAVSEEVDKSSENVKALLQNLPVKILFGSFLFFVKDKAHAHAGHVLSEKLCNEFLSLPLDLNNKSLFSRNVEIIQTLTEELPPGVFSLLQAFFTTVQEVYQKLDGDYQENIQFFASISAVVCPRKCVHKMYPIVEFISIATPYLWKGLSKKVSSDTDFHSARSRFADQLNNPLPRDSKSLPNNIHLHITQPSPAPSGDFNAPPVPAHAISLSSTSDVRSVVSSMYTSCRSSVYSADRTNSRVDTAMNEYSTDEDTQVLMSSSLLDIPELNLGSTTLTRHSSRSSHSSGPAYVSIDQYNVLKEELKNLRCKLHVAAQDYKESREEIDALYETVDEEAAAFKRFWAAEKEKLQQEKMTILQLVYEKENKLNQSELVQS